MKSSNKTLGNYFHLHNSFCGNQHGVVSNCFDWSCCCLSFLEESGIGQIKCVFLMSDKQTQMSLTLKDAVAVSASADISDMF